MELATVKLGNVSIHPAGEYDPEKAYKRLDLITFKNGSYLCTAERNTIITGKEPLENMNSAYWQLVSKSGQATPEYIAMHDKVVNLAERVDADAEEVARSRENVASMEENVKQYQDQVSRDAQAAEQSKNNADLSAKQAAEDRRLAKLAEQSVSDTARTLGPYVDQKTQDSLKSIEDARIQANKSIVAQGRDTEKEVEGYLNPLIKTAEEKKTGLQSRIERSETVNNEAKEAEKTLLKTIQDAEDKRTEIGGIVDDAVGAASAANKSKENADLATQRANTSATEAERSKQATEEATERANAAAEAAAGALQGFPTVIDDVTGAAYKMGVESGKLYFEILE